MGGDEGFFARVIDGAATGAAVGGVIGTSTTFWQSAGIKMNRAQVAKQVVPTIFSNAGYMAGVGATFKAGEALMETWTGKEGEAINTAMGGAMAGAFLGVRSGSLPIIAASAGACSLMCVAIHLNGDKFT